MNLLLCFLANALWQAPLLALSALLAVRVARLRPQTAYALWMGALALSCALPFVTALRAIAPASQPPSSYASQSSTDTRAFPLSVPDAPPHVAMPRQSDSAAVLHPPAARAGGLRGGLFSRLTRLHLQAPPIVAWSLLFSWSVSVLWGTGRLYARFLATSRLLKHASPMELSTTMERELSETARAFRVKVPRVAGYPALAKLYGSGFQSTQGPALAGLWHPTLLLPPEFAAYSTDQRRAVLAHELAHLRRQDSWTRLAASLIALPLLWHPVTAIFRRQLAQSRELATDALAAGRMRSAHHYAHCLFQLAQSLLPGSAPPAMSLGLFQPTLLEERIMQLIRPVRALPLTLRIPMIAAVTLLAGGVTALAASFPVGLTSAARSSASLVLSSAADRTPDVPVPPSLPVQGDIAAPDTTPLAVQQPVPDTARPATRTPSAIPQAAPDATASPSLVQGTETPAPLPSLPAQSPSPGGTSFALADTPGMPHVVAIFHGADPKVNAPDGYRHRWMGADGLPFIAITASPADLTPAQQRALEDQYTSKMKGLPQQIDQSTAFLRSPEFQEQMRKAAQLNSEQLRKQLEQSTLYLRSPEFQKQMQKASQLDWKKMQNQLDQATTFLRSPEFQKQMQAASQFDSKQLQQQIDQSTAYLHSPEFLQQMQRADRTEEMQRQIDDLRSQVAALQRQLARARTGSLKQ